MSTTASQTMARHGAPDRMPFENLVGVSAYRHVGIFFLGATVIPWALWLLAGWNSQRPPAQAWAPWTLVVLGMTGLAAPMFLAGGLIWCDPLLRRDVWGRLFRWPHGSGKYVVLAFLLMPASILLAQALSLMMGHSASQFRLAEHLSFSAGILPAWVILLLAPILEELAWHSYGTDALLRRWPVFTASICFAAYWVVWHIPLTSIKGYYHSNVLLSGWIYSLNLALSIFPFVLLMNWLYLRTGRNVCVAVVFHTTAVAFNEIFQTHPDSKVIQTGLLTLLTCVVLWRERTLFFQKPAIGKSLGF
jgi:membrane protease YdiL (CAAX protease family)